MKLASDQIRTFHQQGYIIVEDLISTDDLAELSTMVHKLLDGELKPEIKYNGEVPDDFYTFWEPGMNDRDDIPRRERIRLMSWMGYYHSYFWAFACHPNIHAVVSALFNDGVQLFGDTIFRKPARHGIESASHQDLAFWPRLRPRSLKCWLAIDQATVENGCMYVIPGSHDAELSHHQHPVQTLLLTDEQLDVGRQVPIELNPSSAIFFDSGVIHRSYPNRSDRSRRSWGTNYVAEHVEHLEPWTLDYRFKLIGP